VFDVATNFGFLMHIVHSLQLYISLNASAVIWRPTSLAVLFQTICSACVIIEHYNCLYHLLTSRHVEALVM